jgi:hypothetical protein
MNHNWYAVLPAQVLLSKELTDKQKLLIALISNLSNERGYCFASNKYLGDCLDCSESTIKDHLKKLEDMNILGRIIKLKENGDFEYRSLIINIEIPRPEKTTTSAEKLANPSARKLAHNNIVINNKDIIDNKLYTENKKFVKPTAKEVNDYAKEIDFKLDGDYFCDWNEARGWLVSKNPMKDWKAAVRTWKRNSSKFNTEPNTQTKIKLK